ncbi:MAG: KpsF/GutQ family sugar-phosphate isomerase [Pirellulaceae bacterium]
MNLSALRRINLPAAKPAAISRDQWLRLAQEVIVQEATTLNAVAAKLGPSCLAAVDRILACRGDVIVTGMGKAGLVGAKLAATFASTGTPSHFLHPAEAIHGDLGRVDEHDVVLVLSQSGETEEIVRLLPLVLGLGATIVGITAHSQSTLGRACEVVLELGSITEACPHNLAPTASTAAMMALGDALALTCSQARGFQPEDFARYHPGGSLGRRLALVEEVMRPLEQCRVSSEKLSIREIFRGSKQPGRRSGAIMLTDAGGKLSGIFTDSDLARLFESAEGVLDFQRPICEVMTRNPKCTEAGTRVGEAVRRLASAKISELPVLSRGGEPLGMIDVTDLVGQFDSATELGGTDLPDEPSAAGMIVHFPGGEQG